MLIVDGQSTSAQNWNLPSGLRSVVFHNAPYFIQEAHAVTDQIWPVDYDGDYLASNNTGPYAVAGSGYTMPYVSNATPKVYYSVVETGYGPDAGYYIIGYFHYHAQDLGFSILEFWGSAGHKNDMEGVWLVVQKSSLWPYGRPVLALTEAHAALIPYWSDTNLPDYNAGPQPTGGFQGRLHSWMDTRYGHDRPVIGIAGDTHGTYAAQDCSGHTLPNTAGSGLETGQGGVGMWRFSEYDYGQFIACIRSDYTDAIFYYPQTVESLSPYDGNDPVQLPFTQVGGLAMYGLEHIQESVMWPLRTTSGQFFSGNVLSLQGGLSGLEFFDGPNGSHDANPPWAFTGGTGECHVNTCYYSWYYDGTAGGYTPRQWLSASPGALLGGSASELARRFPFLPDLNQAERFNPYIANPPDYNQPSVAPLSAAITGKPAVIAGRSGTWSSSVSGGVAPYSYSWSGVLYGSGATVSGAPQTGYLYLDVWDSGGRHATDSFWIDALE
ncbi:MAG: hypothetical protein ACJ79A_04295 [Gemmatimonadaceae bacterium]